MTSSTHSNIAQTDVLPSPRLTVGWALKRAILAVTIIAISMGIMAWLIHSTTQPLANGSSTAAIAASTEQQPTPSK